MKNNSLIKYQEGFFAKLKRKFRSIFFKDNKEEITKIDNKPIINKTELNNENEVKSNKEEFFKLYNQVMKGEVDINSLDKESIAKINEMLEEEVRIKERILAEKTKILNEKKEILRRIVNE